MPITMSEIVNTNNDIIEKHVNLNDEDKKYINKCLLKLNKKALYNSKIHGIYHSEKVFLFCYIIGKQENLNEVDLQIITDAAFYHDVGRINDYEDTLHGYCATLKIESIVNNPIYASRENLNILKAIIDGHSIGDDKRDRFVEDYEITEIERYYKLYDILKDADALDRKRFYDTSSSHLDERYLRTDISKQLIKLSEEINDTYRNKMKINDNKLQLPEKGEFKCFHSVGFDFFKIGSVLENGILSKKEMKRMRIEGASNFEGGNLDDFVSVVDSRFIGTGGTAFPTFIMNGVSFICEVDELYSSNKNYTRSYCLENGIPYNQSFHKDEKYVRSKISPNNIKSIFLSDNIKDKDIRELDYIYNSLSHELLASRVGHYYNSVSNVINPDLNKMTELLANHKKEIDKYLILDQIQKKQIEKQVINNLEKNRSTINDLIKDWIYQKYKQELNKGDQDNITVNEVVRYELQCLGYETMIQNIDNGILISHTKIKGKQR